ncbi:glycosyltransferase [Flavihumibacter sp. R14]|nr:glycosyltransferase [Flavihumibacter soli]
MVQTFTPFLSPKDSLISVVIPTYRRPELLSKCLKALRAQTIDKELFEVIVVHDGQDIVSEKKIKKSFPEVRYYSLKENKGPAAARNYGWLNAKGILIAFTDDDCVPDKNWLNDIRISYHNEAEVAFAGKVRVPLPEFPTDFELNTARLAEAAFITANCICTKAALLRVGGFDERFKMAWREDSDLEFKLLSENIPIKKLETALVIHPVRKVPWGISIKEQKKGMFNALLYKKFPFLYREKIGDTPPYFYYLMIVFFFGMIYGLITSQAQTLEISLVGYLFSFVLFAFKRLKNTSRRVSHVVEILVTSIVIPFASVYWQWYGAYKYRVLFI